VRVNDITLCIAGLVLSGLISHRYTNDLDQLGLAIPSWIVQQLLAVVLATAREVPW